MSSSEYNISVTGHNNDTDLILQSGESSILENSNSSKSLEKKIEEQKTELLSEINKQVVSNKVGSASQIFEKLKTPPYEFGGGNDGNIFLLWLLKYCLKHNILNENDLLNNTLLKVNDNANIYENEDAGFYSKGGLSTSVSEKLDYIENNKDKIHVVKRFLSLSLEDKKRSLKRLIIKNQQSFTNSNNIEYFENLLGEKYTIKGNVPGTTILTINLPNDKFTTTYNIDNLGGVDLILCYGIDIFFEDRDDRQYTIQNSDTIQLSADRLSNGLFGVFTQVGYAERRFIGCDSFLPLIENENAEYKYTTNYDRTKPGIYITNIEIKDLKKNRTIQSALQTSVEEWPSDLNSLLKKWSEQLRLFDFGNHGLFELLTSGEVVIGTKGGDWWDGGRFYEQTYLKEYDAYNGIQELDNLLRISMINVALINNIYTSVEDILKLKMFRILYRIRSLMYHGNAYMLKNNETDYNQLKYYTKTELYNYILENFKEDLNYNLENYTINRSLLNKSNSYEINDTYMVGLLMSLYINNEWLRDNNTNKNLHYQNVIGWGNYFETIKTASNIKLSDDSEECTRPNLNKLDDINKLYDGSSYDVVSGYKSIFYPQDLLNYVGNPETLFALKGECTTGFNFNFDYGFGQANVINQFSKFYSEGSMYNTGEDNQFAGLNGYQVPAPIVASYASDDVRKENVMYGPVKHPITGEQIIAPYRGSPDNVLPRVGYLRDIPEMVSRNPNSQFWGARVNKYPSIYNSYGQPFPMPDGTMGFGPPGSLFWFGATSPCDGVYMRYSEIKMMIAEAQGKLSGFANNTTVSLLKEVIQRSWPSFNCSVEDGNEVVEKKFYEEYFKEFIFENKNRSMKLRRGDFHKESSYSIEVEKNDKNTYMPGMKKSNNELYENSILKLERKIRKNEKEIVASAQKKISNLKNNKVQKEVLQKVMLLKK